MTDNPKDTSSKGQCFCMGTGPELFSLFGKLGVDDARQHFRNARVEMLRGFRAIIDKRIEHLSRPAEKRGATIAVE